MKLTKNELDTLQKVSYCTGNKINDIKNIFFYFLITLLIDAHFGNTTFSLPYIGAITIPEKNHNNILVKKSSIEFTPSPSLSEALEKIQDNKLPEYLNSKIEDKIKEEIQNS